MPTVRYFDLSRKEDKVSSERLLDDEELSDAATTTGISRASTWPWSSRGKKAKYRYPIASWAHWMVHVTMASALLVLLMNQYSATSQQAENHASSHFIRPSEGLSVCPAVSRSSSARTIPEDSRELTCVYFSFLERNLVSSRDEALFLQPATAPGCRAREMGRRSKSRKGPLMDSLDSWQVTPLLCLPALLLIYLTFSCSLGDALTLNPARCNSWIG